MITKKLDLKDVPITSLIPYARNPRINDPAVQDVAASLKEFGLVKNSVVVDEDYVLIAGHTTLKAMQFLGWENVPEVTQVFGLAPAKKKAYRLADNKLGEKATWDDELLALEFEDLMDMEFDLSLTGFSDTEIDFRFPEIPDSEPEYDESIADDVETVTCPKCNHEFPV